MWEKEKEKVNMYIFEFCFELWYKRWKYDWKNVCFLVLFLGFVLDFFFFNLKLLFIEVYSWSWNLKECIWVFDSVFELYGV